MSTTTQTDLTTCTDTELDHALATLYRQHREAAVEERLECHLAIIAVLAEQSIRLEAWRHAKAVS